ncbi:hypothetical protein P0136_05340 [Lentisphaerota bacterium ZTH]|nr:hypothetical protein JYG24_03545 [Lentisphaerota bacterium]WET07415.1 hypothetical protein P0136_05340 [Lentisphaerota bacterium ZTH]
MEKKTFITETVKEILIADATTGNSISKHFDDDNFTSRLNLIAKTLSEIYDKYADNKHCEKKPGQ